MNRGYGSFTGKRQPPQRPRLDVQAMMQELDEPAAASERSKPSANSARSERTKRAKGKRGRASVPSWDEILFGATKSED